MILSKRQLAAVRAKAFDEAASVAGICSCAKALRELAEFIRADASMGSRGITMIQVTMLVALAGIAVSGCISVPPRKLCAKGHQERRSKTLWFNENGRMIEGTWEWNEWVCDEWAKILAPITKAQS